MVVGVYSVNSRRGCWVEVSEVILLQLVELVQFDDGVSAVVRFRLVSAPSILAAFKANTILFSGDKVPIADQDGKSPLGWCDLFRHGVEQGCSGLPPDHQNYQRQSGHWGGCSNCCKKLLLTRHRMPTLEVVLWAQIAVLLLGML